VHELEPVKRGENLRTVFKHRNVVQAWACEGVERAAGVVRRLEGMCRSSRNPNSCMSRVLRCRKQKSVYSYLNRQHTFPQRRMCRLRQLHPSIYPTRMDVTTM